jgi:hypothetical protein
MRKNRSLNGEVAADKRVSPRRRIARPTAVRKKAYYISIFPGENTPVEPEFAELILQLEEQLMMPVWMIIQDGHPLESFHQIDLDTFKGFQSACGEIEPNEPCALLLETPGGSADCSYRIARLFQRRTRKFFTFVPQYAKSAGTLLALAGTEIIMARDAEIGPLDVQMIDVDREEFRSALDAVQSLERLGAFSLSATANMLHFLMHFTQKRTDALLPHVLSYATSFIKPLVDKIDTVDFTKKSRELKVAEDYATILMKGNYPSDHVRPIVSRLVSGYPAHRFVIDRDEAVAGVPSGDGEGIARLKIRPATAEMEKTIPRLIKYLDDKTFVGRLKEKGI